MSLLFLSHSRRNNAEALALRDWLSEHGWDDLFLDLDPERGIVAGERWERALHQAASRCDAVLFLVSRHWLGSEWCRRELHLAQRLNKRVFALLIEDLPIVELPVELTESWQVVSLTSGNDHGAAREVTLPGQTAPSYVYFSQSGLQRLRAGLHKAGLDPHSFPWPPANDPKRPPYRGLRPLMGEDAGIFFGREAPTIELLAQLRGLSDAAPPRLLAILGASGAGKSSFLRAGILPRLARDDRVYLPLPVIRPEQAALSGSSGLVACLREACKAKGLSFTRKQLCQAIEPGASSLHTILLELATKSAVLDWNGGDPKLPTIILPIDQGEELFQAEGQEEARRFLALMSGLLTEEPPNLIAVFTIRSDSYDVLQSAPDLQGISQKTFSLPPMPRGAYRQVIEEPAKLLAKGDRPLKLDPKLTDALLQDIERGGAKDALPLLAFTLERLYLDYGDDGDLRLDEYEDLGRIEGAIETAVEQALKAAQQDPKVPQDREECLKLLRRGLIPWLAGIDPQTNLPRRKVALLSQVPEDARALIGHFIEHRLLATDTDDNEQTTVEPAHEALLRQWGKLRGWLEEDAAALSTLETVKSASRDWEANERESKWLVHQMGRLEDAEALHQRQDLAANLDTTDLRYLEECQKQQDARRDKELKQARDLTEAQRREAEAEKRNAEAQRRVAQRTRIGLLAALALAAVSVALAFNSWQLSDNFRRQAQIAEQRAAELHQVSEFQAAMLGQVDPNSAGQLLTESVNSKLSEALIKEGVSNTARIDQLADFAAQWRRINATDTARELIDSTILKPAVDAIGKQFRDQPLVDARLSQVLADRYSGMGLFDIALNLQEHALATRRKALGSDHPDTLTSINSLGLLLQRQGKFGQAEALVREVLERRRRVLGEDNPDTLMATNSLGLLLQSQGKLEEAEVYFRDALNKRRRTLGSDHRATLVSINNLGDLLRARGKLREAEVFSREALDKTRRLLGDEHRHTLLALSNLGIA